ncbi:4Fe-4S binding protein [Paratractidigestivibacter sp.]|uniref:4Fe-4S binding protein n=1 Tax=Paratractidigestivibacter sp. TaxID=2847316 RepID=UPI002ABD27FC|nr:4Fe-4S binding protein [Paratractidigestivibacter sp.]
MAYDNKKCDFAKAPEAIPGARPAVAAKPKKPSRPRPVAVVMCNGGCTGNGFCEQGCVGCGACEASCRKGAVKLDERGVARVDADACIGCGLCARACPQDIIQMVERRFNITARCSNTDAGPAARKLCASSCIACGACERACPAGAVRVVGNRAVIDWSACIACGMCAAKCPRGVIRDAFGILAQK